ncbi:bola-like protein [Tothia fuscella]|uniref:Bola-like protein n=1 Tax=Tothia fuscella TaxID=1048955 RepID=A0A9P4P2Q1_9PEZI|nr:bola-like protein [Tothia fuscella]
MSAKTDTEAAEVAKSSGVTPEVIKERLVDQLGATHVEIEDLSGGCGQMFEATIVSPQFAKKMTLARHRLVNGALKQEIAAIHAWTPKCFTPEEWEKKNGTSS